MLKMSRNKGFTLIELMMVIAVVGTLATIAISNYITYRRRGYKAAANEDARNAHIAAQAYLHEWPDKSISSVGILCSYGFVQTQDMSLAVSGTQNTPTITAYHNGGDRTYTVDYEGRLA